MANVPSEILRQIFQVRGRDPLTQSLSTVGPNLALGADALRRLRMRQPINKLFPGLAQNRPELADVPFEEAGAVSNLFNNQETDDLKRRKFALDIIKATQGTTVVDPITGTPTSFPGIDPAEARKMLSALGPDFSQFLPEGTNIGSKSVKTPSPVQQVQPFKVDKEGNVLPSGAPLPKGIKAGPVGKAEKEGKINSSLFKGIQENGEFRNGLESLLTTLMNDRESGRNRIIVGVVKGKAQELPLVGELGRQLFTSPENQAFFADVRKNVSNWLTSETGVQRGFKEIQFLKPATMSTDEPESVFLLKGAKNILIGAINQMRRLNWLEGTGHDVSGILDSGVYDVNLIDSIKQRLKQSGVDTDELDRLESLYNKEVAKGL